MRKIAILLLTFSISACIPPGRGDYTVAQNQPPVPTENEAVNTKPTQTAPTNSQSGSVTADAIIVKDSVYVVQPGDTLRGISNKTGASSQIIAQTNGLTDPYIIRSGQRLKITGGYYHDVKPGQTGINIAKAYGASWSDVVALNGLEEPYVLRVGQKLLLPASAAKNAANLTVEQRAAAFDIGIDDIATGSQPAMAENAKAPPAIASATPGAFAGKFKWPVEGKILAGFGAMGGGKFNDGLNIGVPKGTPFHAAADGVVAYSGNEIGVFGGLILINHGSGWVTAYGHADKLNVKRGDRVKSGQTIGLAGESGYVDEPQLHFEIRKDRKPVDPKTYLPKRN